MNDKTIKTESTIFPVIRIKILIKYENASTAKC